jgi:hypothetical protein
MLAKSKRGLLPVIVLALGCLASPAFSVRPCATMTMKVSPATVYRGSQATASGSIKNCSKVKEELEVTYSATGPCDFSLSGTKNLVLGPGETKSSEMPYVIPPMACVGEYKLTVTASLDKVRLGSTSATLTVK